MIFETRFRRCDVAWRYLSSGIAFTGIAFKTTISIVNEIFFWKKIVINWLRLNNLTHVDQMQVTVEINIP